MAPFSIGGSWIINLLIGVGFGVALESSGFGDARKIAGQFYFRELTVLKVMFTAVAVTATLVFWSTSVGLLDYEAIWVNPTYLWPGILGGLVMGVGFVIGGYCPGTSLTSVATGKIDGMFFVGGVAAGAALFGETVGLYDGWWQSSYLGRLTLQEVFGLDAGAVVLLVVLVAVFLFWGGEKLRGALHGDSVPLTRNHAVAAGVLVAAAALLAVRGQPSLDERWEYMAEKYAPRLESGEVAIHPAELLEVMGDDLVDLRILDVRDEASWNLFRLAEAQRFEPETLDQDPHRFSGLPSNHVIVIVDNDQTLANEAWKKVMAASAPNAYVLEGGLNHWLDLYGHTEEGGHDGHQAVAGADALRHVFPVALGNRHPASAPDPHHVVEVEYEKKVKLATKAKKAGGCG